MADPKASKPKEVQVRVEIVKLNQGDTAPIPDIEDVVLDTAATYLDLTNLRATSLPSLASMYQLQKLTLRHNWLQTFDYIESGCKNLIELDLYENKLKDMKSASTWSGNANTDATPSDAASASAAAAASSTSASDASSSTSSSKPTLILPPDLILLDLSFNGIKRIEPLSHLRFLRELFLVSNRIKTIENLQGMHKLRQLELGSNLLRKIENLDDLVNLEELWLGRNKITVIENIEHLTKLKKLSIQSNRLTEIGTGLQKNLELQELYISSNAITSAVGLSTLTKLTTLDLSSNQLTSLLECGLENLKSLQEFWLNSNRFADWSLVLPVFSALAESLQTIYLEANPLVKLQDKQEYVKKIRECVPKITQVDAEIF